MSQQTERYNIFYPAISVGDVQASFGEGRRIGITMQDVAEIVKVTENLSQVPDVSELRIVQRNNKPCVKLGKVLVGVLMWPPVEELANWEQWENSFVIEAPAWLKEMAMAQKITEKGVVTETMASIWIKEMREKLVALNPDDSTLIYFDSLSEIVPNIDKVGDTHVVVPNAENMTEDMIDASRSLLLYTDTFSTANIQSIRRKISLRPWTARHLPKWFLETDCHLTKAGRAMLAYHLTLAAAIDPPVEEEKYFHTKEPKQLTAYGVELVLDANGRQLALTQAFESLWLKVEDGQMFDLQVNRHQLPDEWKGFFRKQAVEISGVIRKGEGGVIELKNPMVRLGLKNEFADIVTYSINPSADIPRNKKV